MDINNIQPAQPGESSSGTNTVLLVIIIVGAIAFAVWWFTMRGSRPVNTTENNPGLNIDVNLPSSGGDDNGGNRSSSGGGTDDNTTGQ